MSFSRDTVYCSKLNTVEFVKTRSVFSKLKNFFLLKKLFEPPPPPPPRFARREFSFLSVLAPLSFSLSVPFFPFSGPFLYYFISVIRDIFLKLNNVKILKTRVITYRTLFLFSGLVKLTSFLPFSRKFSYILKGFDEQKNFVGAPDPGEVPGANACPAGC
jgi:hypothetical protein